MQLRLWQCFRKGFQLDVQRHLKLGQNRAEQLVEDMEKVGAVLVGDKDGVRTVLGIA